MKRRVLVCSEAHWLSTGYATMTREFLSRLHASGKYELFELGSYGRRSDPRGRSAPWGFMGVAPDPGDEEGQRSYDSHRLNEFGKGVFEEACLKFKCTDIISFRDVWMDRHIGESVFRPFYRWHYMPTVDSTPPDDEWLDLYQNADNVLTYTDWARGVLGEYGGIKLRGVAPPGADFGTFKPVKDKRSHKEECGLDPDALIVGIVARNQQRKLYPDLIEGFAQFLGQARPDLASRSYLYLHTAWPDLSWDIPRLLLKNGLAGRVLFTYWCKACGHVFTAFFSDAIAHCRYCGKPAAGFSTSQHGVSNEVLAKVYNLFDVYVQYANAEGLGVPAVEAAACGIPLIAVDYSGMADLVKKLGALPVPVKRFMTEPTTHCLRAMPDNDALVTNLSHLLSLPDPARRALGYRVREHARAHFDWDKSTRRWMDLIDEGGTTLPWDSPPRFHQPQKPPEGLSDDQFIRWCIHHVAGRPDLEFPLAMRMARDLTWGGAHQGRAFEPFDRERALQVFRQMALRKNNWEARRVQCG